MANIKSSKKRVLINNNRKLLNRKKKSILKRHIKKIKNLVKEKNKILALKEFCVFQSFIDKCSSKKIIHRNKSARFKSNLYKSINKIIN